MNRINFISIVIILKMTRFWSYFGFVLFTLILQGCTASKKTPESNSMGAKPFQPTWQSLEQYQVPGWFRDSKFGIFVHWGPQTIAGASGSYDGTKSPWKKLAADFKGEKFDATLWATLFKQSGAKYVVQVAEHHDAYALYESSLTPWSSVKMAPKRDFVKELSDAVRKEGLIYGASSHTEENWWFYSDPPKKAPPAPKPGQPVAEQPPKEFLDNWYARLVEIVEKYDPNILWFDWCIQQPSFEPYLRKLAAYYYNRNNPKQQGVVINYKYDAYPSKAAVLDISVNSGTKWIPEGIHSTPWQFDTWSSNGWWFWRPAMKIRPTSDLIAELADVVSKNGNYLLNVTPDPDGIITPDQVNMLSEIGRWLKVNGEAIYGTRPWNVYGEGPSQGLGPSFSPSVPLKPYSSQDIRFTAKGKSMYAIVLAWPADGKVSIKSLAAGSKLVEREIRRVALLGSNSSVKWSRSADGLLVDLSTQNSGVYPCVLKILQR
jgi:alpha-L-fucosidase